MDQNTRDWLNRVEGKLDTALIAVTKHETDINWLRGGSALILTIILGCAGWIATQYFNNLGESNAKSEGHATLPTDAR